MSKATKQVPPSKSPESRKQRRIIRNLFKAQLAAMAAVEDGDTEAEAYFTARAETLQTQLEAMELEVRKPGRAPKPEAADEPAPKKTRRSRKAASDEPEVAPTADVLEEVAA